MVTVRELSGPQLVWAVAYAWGLTELDVEDFFFDGANFRHRVLPDGSDDLVDLVFDPFEDLIPLQKIGLVPDADGYIAFSPSDPENAMNGDWRVHCLGATPREAVQRLYVVLRVGEHVPVPEAFPGESSAPQRERLAG